MKQPVGFSGSGIWAIVFILIVGVIWIENRFGANVAGAAVLGAFGVAVFLLGQLVNIASTQAHGNIRIAEKEADATVERERVKGEAAVAKTAAQMEQLALKSGLQMGMIFAKQLFAAYKAQHGAQPAPEQDGQTIDLEAIRAQRWTEDDL